MSLVAATITKTFTKLRRSSESDASVLDRRMSTLREETIEDQLTNYEKPKIEEY